MRIKLFEEFSEWDGDEFLFDLYAMSSTEVENLFWEELKSETPHLEKIEIMLESGLVDVGVKDKDVNGWTPLHWATVMNSIELAVLLLERGADVRAKDKYGGTPLHWASANNHIEIAKLLIDRGADLEAKSNWGTTPLHWASANNHIEIAKLLIDRGADVEVENDRGETPFDYAETDEMRALLGGEL